MSPLTTPQPDNSAPAVEDRALSEFRRAAADVLAYRTLLDEEGVRATDVRDLASFSRACPLLSKRNTPPNPAVAGLPDGLPTSVFTALQEQLGLKLESIKGSSDVLIIDHVEQPTPD
jgi:uncharacterized protein (TIGR03435 family)